MLFPINNSIAHRRPAWAVIVIGAIGLVCAGCGASGPAVWPVKGRVFFRDRTPVASGVIEFSPVDGGPTARATIGTDGRFVLRTGERSGAVAGNHRIAIVQLVNAERAPPSHIGMRHTAKVVHPKYRRFQTSDLSRVVEAIDDNDFIIEVEAAVERLGW
jgi:hypothetical protein